MTPEQIADAHCSLDEFSMATFPGGAGLYKRNWHLRVIAEELEKVVLGLSQRLIINVPPRSGKTKLAVISFIAWSMGIYPDSEYIHASYSKRLATKNTYEIRALMLSDVYREIFPHVKITEDSRARDEFRTAAGGVVYATGNAGTITGYGAGKMREDFGGAILIDDPSKPGEALSKVKRTNVIDWFLGTMEGRKNNPQTPIVVVMQRQHVEDLAGFLLAGGNGEKWKLVKIQALDQKERSFWEIQFPREKMLIKKAADPYHFAGQYKQEPYLPGGNLIHSADFGRYGVLPLLKYRKIYADTAQKTKEHNDYTVLQCWGLGKDGKIYLIDQIRGKWEAHELETRTVDFWNKHGAWGDVSYGKLRGLEVEDSSSGTGLIQNIRRKHQIPIHGIVRVKDKLTRCMDILGYIKSGYVMIPSAASWVSDFTSECDQFRSDDTHLHDDQIDPLMDAINEMLGAKPSQAFDFAALREISL